MAAIPRVIWLYACVSFCPNRGEELIDPLYFNLSFFSDLGGGGGGGLNREGNLRETNGNRTFTVDMVEAPPRSNVWGSFFVLFREISFTTKWKHE